jgi:hypothetical protein
MSPRISSYSTGSDLLSAVKQMRTVQAYNFLSISGSASGTAICISHQINNYTLTFKGPLGNAPRLGLWTSVVNPSTSTLSNLPNFFYSTQNTSTTLRLITNDGRDDGVRLCNGVGKSSVRSSSHIHRVSPLLLQSQDVATLRQVHVVVPTALALIQIMVCAGQSLPTPQDG